MPYRLEIALKSELFDAEGNGIRRKAKNYFGIELVSVRCVYVVTIDADLSKDQLKTIQTQIFTNPVTQVSSLIWNLTGPSGSAIDRASEIIPEVPLLRRWKIFWA